MHAETFEENAKTGFAWSLKDVTQTQIFQSSHDRQDAVMPPNLAEVTQGGAIWDQRSGEKLKIIIPSKVCYKDIVPGGRMSLHSS